MLKNHKMLIFDISVCLPRFLSVSLIRIFNESRNVGNTIWSLLVSLASNFIRFIVNGTSETTKCRSRILVACWEYQREISILCSGGYQSSHSSNLHGMKIHAWITSCGWMGIKFQDLSMPCPVVRSTWTSCCDQLVDH